MGGTELSKYLNDANASSLEDKQSRTESDYRYRRVCFQTFVKHSKYALSGWCSCITLGH
jgi:hypothetical protein